MLTGQLPNLCIFDDGNDRSRVKLLSRGVVIRESDDERQREHGDCPAEKVSELHVLMLLALHIPIEVRRRNFCEKREETYDSSEGLVENGDDVQWNAEFAERPTSRR